MIEECIKCKECGFFISDYDSRDDQFVCTGCVVMKNVKKMETFIESSLNIIHAIDPEIMTALQATEEIKRDGLVVLKEIGKI